MAGLAGTAIQADDITTEDGSGRFMLLRSCARFSGTEGLCKKRNGVVATSQRSYTFGPYPGDKLIVQTRPPS